MTWQEMERLAFEQVDTLWQKRSGFFSRKPNTRDLVPIVERFVTQQRVRELWRDDPDTVRRFAEENGVEDVLEYPELDHFDHEVGEAVTDQVHGAMLMRFADLESGRAKAGTIEPGYGQFPNE